MSARRPYRGSNIRPDWDAKLRGWASAPFVQEHRQAHVRERAERQARERRQREVERQAAALRHANTLQRHQQDVARFNALADALLNPEEPTEW